VNAVWFVTSAVSLNAYTRPKFPLESTESAKTVLTHAEQPRAYFDDCVDPSLIEF
jgi:hypothetical protein